MEPPPLRFGRERDPDDLHRPDPCPSCRQLSRLLPLPLVGVAPKSPASPSPDAASASSTTSRSLVPCPLALTKPAPGSTCFFAKAQRLYIPQPACWPDVSSRPAPPLCWPIMHQF